MPAPDPVRTTAVRLACRVAIGAIALLAGLGGCGRWSKCKPSRPPVRGMIYSCCGADGPRAYYWTGEACLPNRHCQCDARPASPQWDTLDECQRAHEGCR